jgi:hypothetical protein
VFRDAVFRDAAFRDAVFRLAMFKDAVFRPPVLIATVLTVAVLGSSAVVRGESPAESTDWSWQTTEESVALMRSEQVIWKFQYSDDQDVPFFHPLATSSGRVLTWNSPRDHVWHHGFWFSWKYLNEVNYWELNRETGKPDGRTRWSDVRVETHDDHSAKISITLDYRPATGGEAVLEEQRRITISAPERDGSYRIDWSSRFTAASGDVLLDRTPPKEQSWGGYAGLSIRFAPDLTERQAISSMGPVKFGDGDRYRGRSPAIDYSGLIDGQSVGVAFLDHPDNPRYPTPWYLIRSPVTGYMNAALLNDEPLTLEFGKTLALRYRLIVHSDRWDAERLQAEIADFQSATFGP